MKFLLPHKFIREVFENYGYIDMDLTEPEDKGLHKWVKERVIKMELQNEHGPGGGWPEYRFTGTYGMLLKLLETFFSEDKDFLDEFFVKLNSKPSRGR